MSTPDYDSFGRTVASGWGSADVGGSYAVTGNGLASDFSVTPAAGLITARLSVDTGVQITDWVGLVQEVVAKLQNDGSGTGSSPCIRLRCQGNAHYLVKVGYQSYDPTFIQFRFYSTTDSVNYTLISQPNSATAVGTNQTVWVRARATPEGASTRIQARLWLDGSAEPSGSWQLNSTDSTAALQTAGGVGCHLFGISSPSVATFIYLAATDLVQATPAILPGRIHQLNRLGRRGTPYDSLLAPIIPAPASLAARHPVAVNANLRR